MGFPIWNPYTFVADAGEVFQKGSVIVWWITLLKNYLKFTLDPSVQCWLNIPQR